MHAQVWVVQGNTMDISVKIMTCWSTAKVMHEQEGNTIWMPYEEDWSISAFEYKYCNILIADLNQF